MSLTGIQEVEFPKKQGQPKENLKQKKYIYQFDILSKKMQHCH